MCHTQIDVDIKLHQYKGLGKLVPCKQQPSLALETNEGPYFQIPPNKQNTY